MLYLVIVIGDYMQGEDNLPSKYFQPDGTYWKGYTYFVFLCAYIKSEKNETLSEIENIITSTIFGQCI